MTAYLYFDYYEGGLFEGVLVGGDDDYVVITGQISGDKISGTWEDTDAETSGTWSGKRTL